MLNGLNQTEIFILNKYLVSELVGGLILGNFARNVDDLFLKNKLLWHCEEEIKHSAQWSDLFKKLNVPVIKNVKTGEKKEFFSYVREITCPIEFLAALQVFEIRVPFHYGMHSLWTKNEELKSFLDEIIEDEKRHISWVETYLLKERMSNPEKVDLAMKKFMDLEESLYQQDLAMLNFTPDMKSFVDLVKENYPKYLEERNSYSLIKNIL
jgi:rubrerythrin